jgi:hypothetical protein
MHVCTCVFSRNCFISDQFNILQELNRTFLFYFLIFNSCFFLINQSLQLDFVMQIKQQKKKKNFNFDVTTLECKKRIMCCRSHSLTTWWAITQLRIHFFSLSFQNSHLTWNVLIFLCETNQHLQWLINFYHEILHSTYISYNIFFVIMVTFSVLSLGSYISFFLHFRFKSGSGNFS